MWNEVKNHISMENVFGANMKSSDIKLLGLRGDPELRKFRLRPTGDKLSNPIYMQMQL